MNKVLFGGCGCEGDCNCNGGNGDCLGGNCGQGSQEDHGQQGGE